MDGLFERIDIQKDWFENRLKRKPDEKQEGWLEWIFGKLDRDPEYIDIVNMYTKLAAEYYRIVHKDSIIYDEILEFGSYTYLNVSVVYREDTKKYYLFEYCVDSMQCCSGAGPSNWKDIVNNALIEVQIVMDRRASFNTKDLLEYLFKKVGTTYTFGIACWTSPDKLEENINSENEKLKYLVKWMNRIEDTNVEEMISKIMEDTKETKEYSKPIEYVEEGFYESHYKSRDFDGLVTNWKDKKYPRYIQNHPIFLAFMAGDFMQVDMLLDTGLPYMTLNEPYLDDNIMYFGVDAVDEKYQDEMWRFMLKRGMKYDTSGPQGSLLDSILYSYESDSFFDKDGELKEWVKEFIRLDAKNEYPVIFRLNGNGTNFYRMVYINGNSTVDKLDRLIQFINQAFEGQEVLDIKRPQWTKTMDELRNYHIEKWNR